VVVATIREGFTLQRMGSPEEAAQRFLETTGGQGMKHRYWMLLRRLLCLCMCCSSSERTCTLIAAAELLALKAWV